MIFYTKGMWNLRPHELPKQIILQCLSSNAAVNIRVSIGVHLQKVVRLLILVANNSNMPKVKSNRIFIPEQNYTLL